MIKAAKSGIEYRATTVFIAVGVLALVLGFGRVVKADIYSDSAHGNASYGVNRSGTGYDIGSCAHCHDTFDESICGVNSLMLFAPNDTNFCFKCHDNTTTYATTPIVNRSYSYRAGGWTADPVDDILEAFSFTSPGTSHDLDDIKTFIDGKWNYTVDSNPCTACHNHHHAQRDPHAAADRGWPVSRPSGHATMSTWQLWGDDAGERMDQYTTYQAPNAVSGYEPDGSTTEDGSNLTDYVSFCTDCHNATNDTIWSTRLNGYLKTIDWTMEKHGLGDASDDYDTVTELKGPYQDDTRYVLACTDCHEPHGSPNIFLTRQRVNNGNVTVLTGTGQGPYGRDLLEWIYLCDRCHEGLDATDTGPNHPHPFDYDDDPDYDCYECHDGANIRRPCGECHFHGNTSVLGFDYGEPLF